MKLRWLKRKMQDGGYHLFYCTENYYFTIRVYANGEVILQVDLENEPEPRLIHKAAQDEREAKKIVHRLLAGKKIPTEVMRKRTEMLSLSEMCQARDSMYDSLVFYY